jgi:hypothetical protein
LTQLVIIAVAVLASPFGQGAAIYPRILCCDSSGIVEKPPLDQLYM